MSRPDKLPEWARVPQQDPAAPFSAQNIKEPSEALKDTGFIYDESIASNNFNYLINNACDWFKYIDTFDTATGNQVGDFDVTTEGETEADREGWLLMADDTWDIGSAASAAHYKDDKYYNLFVHLWDTYDESKCPVSGGPRGANADADWNANRTIRFFPACGRLLAAAGTASISSFISRANGDTYGNDSNTLAVNENPVITNNHTHQYLKINAGTIPFNSTGAGQCLNTTGGEINIFTSGHNYINGGNATPYSIVQPVIYLDLLIKY